jgi:hypothetical protein
MVVESGASGVERSLDMIAARVVARLGPSVSVSAVRAVARLEVEEFQSARIVDFVPVFVERRTTRRLRAGENRGS